MPGCRSVSHVSPSDSPARRCCHAGQRLHVQASHRCEIHARRGSSREPERLERLAGVCSPCCHLYPLSHLTRCTWAWSACSGLWRCPGWRGGDQCSRCRPPPRSPPCSWASAEAARPTTTSRLGSSTSAAMRGAGWAWCVCASLPLLLLPAVSCCARACATHCTSGAAQLRAPSLHPRARRPVCYSRSWLGVSLAGPAAALGRALGWPG